MVRVPPSRQFLTHPNRLLAGTPAKLKVLYDGKPIAGQLISIQRGALEAGQSTSPVEVRCDAEGGAMLE